MHQRRWRAAIAAAGVASVLVAGMAACSKKSDSSSGGGGGDDSDHPAARKLPGTAMLAASRDQIKDGGNLRLAVDQYLGNFNPFQTDGNNVANIPVNDTILPTFFRFTKGGDPVPDKNYLISGEVTSQDPFEVTMTVNPKAEWSDGAPVGYEDFKDMWQANNGKNKAYQIVSSNGFEEVTAVEQGKDDRQIVITFDRPYAAWPELFNGLLPASLTADPKKFNTAWKDKATVSAGPFMVQKVDPTSQIITLAPNPHWWGDKPKLDQITLRVLDENAQVRAYANDEIDEVVIGTNADALKQAENRDHSKIYKAASLNWYHIDMNGTSPLLHDPKVRQAIMQGINREAIVSARLTPVGVPPTVRNNHLYNEAQNGYEDNATSVVGYDADKAQSALDDLGWKKDGDFRKKDGKTLQIRYVIPSGNDRQTAVAEQIQNQLQQIGVQVKIQTVNTNDYFLKYIDKGNFDMVYFQWTGGGFPECSQKSIFYPAKSSQNKNFISAENIGTSFDDACATMDASARKKAGNVVDKAIFELGAMVPLYTDPAIAAMNDKLANFDLDTSSFEAPVWESVGFVK